MNMSGIHDHMITVEMPAGISAKTSARTGQHFYKHSGGNNVITTKNSI
jgi:hypothetical protein